MALIRWTLPIFFYIAVLVENLPSKAITLLKDQRCSDDDNMMNTGGSKLNSGKIQRENDCYQLEDNLSVEYIALDDCQIQDIQINSLVYLFISSTLFHSALHSFIYLLCCSFDLLFISNPCLTITSHCHGKQTNISAITVMKFFFHSAFGICIPMLVIFNSFPFIIAISSSFVHSYFNIRSIRGGVVYWTRCSFVYSNVPRVYDF